MNVDFQVLKDEVEKITVAGDIESILGHDTAYKRFRETAMNRPESLAIKYMGRDISFQNLLKDIDSVANVLSGLGIEKNTIVTTSLLCTPSAIVLFYALDKIGATQHMINCAASPNEIKREITHIPSDYFIGNDIFCTPEMMTQLRMTGVKKIITTSLIDYLEHLINSDSIKFAIAEKVKGLKKSEYKKEDVFSYRDLLANTSKYSPIEAVDYEENHNATIAYTSGSTGSSKACVATWEGIDSMVQVMGMTEQGRFQPDDVMLSTFPLWIYYSLLNMIHEPLCLGVTLALDPLFKPERIPKRNKQYKFNFWLTIPPYLKAFLDSGKSTDCSKWKIVLTGGAELPNELKRRAIKYVEDNGGNIEVVQGYGASECLGSFAYCYYPNSTEGCLGKPCIGNMLKILDVETNEELGVNQSGVGYFYSPALMKEYYGDPEATNHNLVKDANGVTWYNTEDIIHINDKGEIFLDGRLRRIALALDKDLNPTKIIPERTRRELSMHPAINKCEVVTAHDDIYENVAVGFVVLKEGFEASEDLKKELIDYSKSQVPEYMATKEIVFMDDLPMNATGKVDIVKLEKMANNEKI